MFMPQKTLLSLLLLVCILNLAFATLYPPVRLRRNLQTSDDGSYKENENEGSADKTSVEEDYETAIDVDNFVEEEEDEEEIIEELVEIIEEEEVEDNMSMTCPSLLEPPLPGVFPGTERPKLILAQDIDYPPYTLLGPLEEDSPVAGFGPEFGKGLEEVCDIDVYNVQTAWSRCWDTDHIGEGLALGQYHACSSYTHGRGIRPRFLEFSKPILNDKKASGLLTRLDADGNPVVSSLSNLEGVKVVDVVGFAPAESNLAIVTNDCTGEKFSGYEFVPPTETTTFPNDDAMRTLLNGDADVLWTYADSVENFACANNEQPTSWDCTIWDGLGTDYAYIHSGMEEWSIAGTTLTIAKIGSGVAALVNPCIDAFMETESYYNLCLKYDLVDLCFTNEFFPSAGDSETALYDIPNNELETDCSSGYCACPAR